MHAQEWLVEPTGRTTIQKLFDLRKIYIEAHSPDPSRNSPRRHENGTTVSA